MNDARSKPNVLIIHSDQHKFDCLGCTGNPDVKTPHIDALAKDGVVFKNCFSTFPVCTPSRYSLLTGLYVHQHLGWTNRSTLPHGLETYPRIMKRAGYNTACVGKMHFTPTYADVGFDRMFLAEQDGPGRWDDDYHRYLREHGLIDAVDMQDQLVEFRGHLGDSYFETFGAEPSNLPEEHYSTTWIGNKAMEEIKRWSGGGNLLFVGFIKPHHPHDAPAPWSEMYNPSELELPGGWTSKCLEDDLSFYPGYFNFAKMDQDTMRLVLSKYYASISQIDHHVGRMISLLKEKNLYDNTLVIYTSDHGDYMGFHHLVLKGNYMYDPVIKVPLVVKYPGSREAGKSSDGLVSIIDIMATILDETGCIIPQHLWETVMPLDPSEGREIVHAEDHRGNYMIRTPTRKLLACKNRKDRFYNLEEDPFELDNRIDDPSCKEEIKALQQRFAKWLAFEAQAPVHQDELGPIADAPNARRIDQGHREDIEDWFRQKMRHMAK